MYPIGNWIFVTGCKAGATAQAVSKREMNMKEKMMR
jgi:hypothetical protein